MEQQEKLYAIIDGAVEEELLSMLSQLDPPVSCLYLEPVQEELIELAPYLVQVTTLVKEWLDERQNSPWGIYLTSYADLKTLRQHLRKYLQVIVPDEEKPVFFRFYDPRNIWTLCGLLTDWQLHQFLGPIHSITISHEGTEFTENFKLRREQFPGDVVFRGKLLTFDMEQMTQFTTVLESRYILMLSNKMKKWSDSQQTDYHSFATELFYYLDSLEIVDDRTIQGLAKLFILRNFTCLDDIPTELKNRLLPLKYSSQTHAEKLLIDELGSVPLLSN